MKKRSCLPLCYSSLSSVYIPLIIVLGIAENVLKCFATLVEAAGAFCMRKLL